MMNTCDNPDLSNYFDKNFAEYKKGFQSKGKIYSHPPISQIFNLLRPLRVSCKHFQLCTGNFEIKQFKQTLQYEIFTRIHEQTNFGT